ncbi:MAG TPA: hypothetical protein VFH78_01625 [Candidatus Thermoplasmatota archaeon]|nr:hypothetical protein [Candidatus Thermoplasmatota archaeon]
MRHTILISLLLLLSTAAPARAEAAAFGFEDAPFDAKAPGYADIVAGSLVVEGERVRATVELMMLPGMTPGSAYGFLFHDGEKDWYAAAVAVPDVRFFYGEWETDELRPRDTFETTGTVSPGFGGSVTIEFPLRALGNATTLSAPRGLSGDLKGEFVPVPVVPVFLVLDEARGEGELALRDPAQEPVAAASEPAPAAAAPAATAEEPSERAVPAAGAAAALAALALALAAARRARP